ncbi:MAG TPA: hypothetical protein DIV86_02100, partial [Alphaproteobacteria bacterium]|nr:hypothetical protein [Alphaproteobacteria bacterium]
LELLKAIVREKYIINSHFFQSLLKFTTMNFTVVSRDLKKIAAGEKYIFSSTIIFQTIKEALGFETLLVSQDVVFESTTKENITTVKIERVTLTKEVVEKITKFMIGEGENEL